MNTRHKTSAAFVAFAVPPTLGLKHLLDWLMRHLTETSTTLVEFESSSIFLAIGVVLALPSEALVRTIPLFGRMLNVMPEHPWWSGAFLALGVMQAWANLKRYQPVRRYAAFIAAILFGFLGMLGVVSEAPVMILGAIFLVHSFVQGFVYLQLGVFSGAK